jgi:hypothetical protein
LKDLNISNARVRSGELGQHILGIAFYRKDKEKNNGADLSDTKFLFNNETHKGITYTTEGDLPRAEDLNNIFGITGMAFGKIMGFDEELLLRRAGKAEMDKWAKKGKEVPESWRPRQLVIGYNPGGSGAFPILGPPYGDNPDDHEWIKKGIMYYYDTHK